MAATPRIQSITLHDVARAAGVSPITASRALTNPHVVSEATREKVRRAVEQTGYIANALAGGLKSRRSMTVGALVPVISVQQFLPTVQTLTHELDSAGYQVILGQTGYDHAREAALLETMVRRRVDGIVVAGVLADHAGAERVRRLGIPIVEMWELSDRPVDMAVGFSHLKVGSAVGGYFMSRGWTRLAVATGDDRRAGLRREGFIAAVGREVPTAVVPAPSSLGLGRAAAAQLLDANPSIEAIFCSADALAHGVLTEALARGIDVPKDLVVCGFGDADFAAHLHPSLTTVRVDAARIGHEAARLILQRCRGQPLERKVVDVGFEIVVRRSTELVGDQH